MGLRSFTAHTPQGCWGWVLAILSYTPVFFVYLLIFSVLIPYYAYFIFDAIAPWWEARPIAYFAIAGTSFMWTGLLLVSYTRAIVANPGFLDVVAWRRTPVYSHDAVVAAHRAHYALPNDEAPLNVVHQLNQHGELRYCGACKAFKPDRCHHCRTCGRCVMEMDHHCPWINNCVGRDNHKYFILFLLHAGAHGAHNCVTIYIGLGMILSSKGWAAKAACLYVGGVSISISIVLLLFAMLEIYLISSEGTLIEHHVEHKGYNWCGIRNWSRTCRHVAYERLAIVFGRNMLLWCVPVKTPPAYKSPLLEV